MAAKLYIAAKADHQPFDPRDHGFEFSATDVEAYYTLSRHASGKQNPL